MSELPCTTPSEARRVWEAMGRTSTRRVARQLTQSGRRVSHETINRWRRQGWRALDGEPRHPLDNIFTAYQLTPTSSDNLHLSARFKSAGSTHRLAQLCPIVGWSGQRFRAKKAEAEAAVAGNTASHSRSFTRH
jgi:hypothetical protein